MGTATKARVKLLIARALSSFLTPAAFVISVALIAAVIASEIVWGFGRNWMFYHVNHVLFVDQNIGKVDGIDARDITGEGTKDILAGAESGIIHWYEQTGPGVFGEARCLTLSRKAPLGLISMEMGITRLSAPTSTGVRSASLNRTRCGIPAARGQGPSSKPADLTFNGSAVLLAHHDCCAGSHPALDSDTPRARRNHRHDADRESDIDRV